MNWQEKIFSVSDEQSFEQVALEIFDYQSNHCKVYKDYVAHLQQARPKKIREIPFLPISFYKTHRVISDEKKELISFKSSGTTESIRSRHLVADINLYKASFIKAFCRFIYEPEEMVLLALLPNYLDQGESSLIYMVDTLMQVSHSKLSAYMLNNPDLLMHHYQEAQKIGKKVIIFGVTYALLDLAASSVDLSQAIIIETGGMKGRRKELPKEEVHAILKQAFGVSQIYSEYGMTEMLSQAYSVRDQIYQNPPWMNVLIRDINDPLSYVLNGKTGGINIIDLANVYSCSFLATQDLGRMVDGGFKILGRFDHSDTRGCNLLIE